MANDAHVGVEVEGLAQPRDERFKALHRRIVKFTRLIGVADLDGHGVVVRGVRAVGDLRQRHALQNFTLQPHDKMRARVGLVRQGEVGEKAAVIGGTRAGIADIVHHHAGNFPERRAGAGVFVYRNVVDCDKVRHADIRTGETSVRERIAQLHAAENKQNEREQDEEGFLTPGAAAPAPPLCSFCHVSSRFPWRKRPLWRGGCQCRRRWEALRCWISARAAAHSVLAGCWASSHSQGD